VLQPNGQLGPCAALPEQLNARDIPFALDVQHDVIKQRAEQLFAITVSGAQCVPDAIELAGEASQRAPFGLGQRCGAMPVEL
jgi:hypothetical protein